MIKGERKSKDRIFNKISKIADSEELDDKLGIANLVGDLNTTYNSRYALGYNSKSGKPASGHWGLISLHRYRKNPSPLHTPRLPLTPIRLTHKNTGLRLAQVPPKPQTN